MMLHKVCLDIIVPITQLYIEKKIEKKIEN